MQRYMDYRNFKFVAKAQLVYFYELDLNHLNPVLIIIFLQKIEFFSYTLTFVTWFIISRVVCSIHSGLTSDVERNI